METDPIAQPSQQHCEQCLYFQEEQWNTGYCRFHHIYVLKTFDCPRHVKKEGQSQQEPETIDGGF